MMLLTHQWDGARVEICGLVCVGVLVCALVVWCAAASVCLPPDEVKSLGRLMLASVNLDQPCFLSMFWLS